MKTGNMDRKHKLNINEIKEIVSKISKIYGVERVSIFGSYARGSEDSNSDIDLRVDKGDIKGLFKLSAYHLNLEEELGSKVDILTTGSLDNAFLESIKKEEILLYEQ